MTSISEFEAIKHVIDDVKAVHSSGGFENPQRVVEALEMLLATVERLARKQAKLEYNVANRLGTMLATSLEGDFIKRTILNAAPNYPYGKDDPEQLEFDKMVDGALRASLRGRPD